MSVRRGCVPAAHEVKLLQPEGESLSPLNSSPCFSGWGRTGQCLKARVWKVLILLNDLFMSLNYRLSSHYHSFQKRGEGAQYKRRDGMVDLLAHLVTQIIAVLRKPLIIKKCYMVDSRNPYWDSKICCSVITQFTFKGLLNLNVKVLFWLLLREGTCKCVILGTNMQHSSVYERIILKVESAKSVLCTSCSLISPTKTSYFLSHALHDH